MKIYNAGFFVIFHNHKQAAMLRIIDKTKNEVAMKLCSNFFEQIEQEYNCCGASNCAF